LHCDKQTTTTTTTTTTTDETQSGGSKNKPQRLFNPAIVFTFYSKSDHSPPPGMGSGETIPEHATPLYNSLKHVEHWRRKLDDNWTDDDAPFIIDGKHYASVEHYVQSCKFKRHNPEFARLFTLESDSEISKNASLCKIAGSATGRAKPTNTYAKHKRNRTPKLVRPPEVMIDPEFNERKQMERKRALHAKFTQNEHLSHVLQSTHDALLMQHIPTQSPQPDMDLMQLRHTVKYSV
jgi:predicted NAD-dependent protein-ADP-ribosyltransferase YbiA (DUF1768 family)